MNLRLSWLWMWYLIGAFAYIIKRAFYGITGPNPVANSWREYAKVAAVPVLFRLLVDSLIYWVLFYPQLAQSLLKYFGWEDAASVVATITNYAPVACLFGLSVDPMTDWGIGTVVNKIPFLKDWWPQMPPALPKPSIEH